MNSVRDGLLEEVLSQFAKEDKAKARADERKVKTFEKRARISIEAMFIINALRKSGWDFSVIAHNAHVNEQTIMKWAAGEAVPHFNNLIILRKLRESIK